MLWIRERLFGSVVRCCFGGAERKEAVKLLDSARCSNYPARERARKEDANDKTPRSPEQNFGIRMREKESSGEFTSHSDCRMFEGVEISRQ